MNWPALGVIVWVSGAVIILAWRSTVSWRLQRVVAQSAEVSDERLLTRMRESATNAGVSAQFRVSAHCRVPMAFGIWRRAVVLPARALEWSDARLSAALRHECGHLQRNDCLTRLFADLVCGFYWINPLVWMAARALRIAQEQACDDLVIRSGADATDYATQLVEVVRSLGDDPFSTRHALAMAQPSTLETRVTSIIDAKRDRRPLSRRAVASGVAAVFLSLVLCGAAQLAAAESPEPSPKAKRAAQERKAGEAQLEFETEFVEFPDAATARSLLSGPPGRMSSGFPKAGRTIVFNEEHAQLVFKQLNGAKGVDLLAAPRVTTLPNQQAKIEISQELRYATEWERDTKPGSWKGKTFETKRVGTTLEIKAAIGKKGTLDLTLAPMVVELVGYTDLDAGGKTVVSSADLSKAPGGHRTQPVFSTRKINTTTSALAGQTVVMELGPAQGRRAQRPLLVFVTAKILKPASARKADTPQQK